LVGLANKANNRQTIVPKKDNIVGWKLFLFKNIIIPSDKKAVAKIIKKILILIKAFLAIKFFIFPLLYVEN